MPRITKPTTKARRRIEQVARKEAVLSAAEDTFIEDGYLRATNEKIASKAGVSVGTVYNLYGSKEKLYAGVIEKVGREMALFLKESLLPLENPDIAFERLIRFRLRNFQRHRLLLALFSSEKYSGAYPNPEALSKKAKSLYYNYIELVAVIFEKGMDRQVFERTQSFNLALSFEGVVNAFVGYWMRPGMLDNLEIHAANIKDTFMRLAGIKRALPESEPADDASKRREIYVTSFDMARIRELIAVARAFGSEDNSSHLNDLENELKESKVVEPSCVPADVITMNSKARLVNLESGENTIINLVFPADAAKEKENLSILEPLGTELLGERIGEIIEVEISGQKDRLEVKELLYQPESAGDYHR